MNVKKIDRKKFEQIRERLRVDIVGAHYDYELHTRLEKRLAGQIESANQSRVFWRQSLNALLNSAIARLCRVYDNDYIGMLMYLKIVEHNMTWFNQPHKSTAPKKLIEYPRPFKPETLGRAIASVSKSHGTHVNTMIDGLLELRNEQVAHIGTRIVGSGKPMPRRALTYRGFKTLLDRSLKLLNLYSKYYDRNTYSPNLAGIDDFTFVTDAIDERLKRLRESD